MEVTLLTGSRNGPGNSGGMPGTNTSDLPVTSMGLLLEMPGSPSFHDSSESLSFCDTDDINQLVLIEDLVNTDFLFEVFVGESNFFSNVLSTVDLNFENVVFLLAQVFHQVHLSVSNDSHNRTVLLNSVELNFYLLRIFVRFCSVVCEGLFL